MTRSAALLLAVALGTLPFASGAEPDGFLFQLDGLDPDAVAASPFPILVTDGLLLSPEEVVEVRDGGRRTVLAYVSIGEAEDYRYYWQKGWHPGSPSWLGPENPYWPRAYRVRYWEEGWRAILFGSEGAYLDRVLAAGFDGVYLDRVDSCEYWGPKNRDLRPTAAADVVDLVADIAEYCRARRPGFLVFPQNALGLLEEFPDYLALIDGAGAEQTWYRSNRKASKWHSIDATRRLDLLVAAGKTALCTDYPRSRKKVDDFFAKAQAKGYLPFCGVRALDETTLDPAHVPGEGPRVSATAPPDGADASREEPPTLDWSGTEGAVEYRVTFTGEAHFRKTVTAPRRNRWIADTTLTPGAKEWRKLVRLAVKAKSDTVWWWVTARDAEGRLRTGRARRLTLR